jgi:hypothetical protein
MAIAAMGNGYHDNKGNIDAMQTAVIGRMANVIEDLTVAR